jgi:PPM family protein phosphatase
MVASMSDARETRETPTDALEAGAGPASQPRSEATSDAPPSTGATSPGGAPKPESDPPASTDEKGGGEVSLRLFGRTDVGQIREHNEDNFIVADLTKNSRGLMEGDRIQLVGPHGTLLGVCDGMGGAAAGEVASQLAVDIIYQKMVSGEPPLNHDELATRLVQAIEAAGMRIFSEAKLDRTRRGMGTTATIAALLDDHLFFGQVGDSRAYILREDRLVQVTRDQSLVNQLIEAGQLTEEEAETFEHNNIILQALGTADSVQVDLTYVALRRGDTLLLCSDGLSGMVRNEEIREVLRTVEEPLEACKVLTDRANQAGGHDNITVVVAKFEGDGLVAPTSEDVSGLRYQKYQLAEPPVSSIPPPSDRAETRTRRDSEMGGGGKPSSRPPRSLRTPDIESSELDDDDHDYYDDDVDRHGEPRGDDAIQIPTEGAPTWLVVMMLVSAVACVVIAGYYLLS